MSHEIFYVQQASHEMLTFLLVGGAVSSAVVVAFALYLRWQSRHARKAARLQQAQRKDDRRRRRRGQ